MAPIPTTVTTDDYLKKRDGAAPLTPEMEQNMITLLLKINTLFTLYRGVYYGVSSGYRPPFINSTTPNAATHSCHLTCEAVDLRDPGAKITTWCAENISTLERLGLYMESPVHTPGWCHLQTRPTHNRIFLP